MQAECHGGPAAVVLAGLGKMRGPPLLLTTALLPQPLPPRPTTHQLAPAVLVPSLQPHSATADPQLWPEEPGAVHAAAGQTPAGAGTGGGGSHNGQPCTAREHRLHDVMVVKAKQDGSRGVVGHEGARLGRTERWVLELSIAESRWPLVYSII